MAKYAADRVRNVSTVWLGATMGCAECHDHKFDPFTTREFYSLAAFFADVKETAVGVQEPTRFPSPEQAEALGPLERTSRRAQGDQEARPKPRSKKLAELEKQIEGAASSRSRRSLVTTSIPPRTMRVLPRGNWLDDSGPVVHPGVPGLAAAAGRSRTAARRGSTWPAGWSRATTRWSPA